MRNFYKYFIYFFIIICIPIVISNCTISNVNEDERRGIGNGYSEFEFEIYSALNTTKAPTDIDSNLLSNAETEINKVRIYAFNGNVLDTVIVKTFSNTYNSCSFTALLKESEYKNFYVLVNEPDREGFDIQNNYKQLDYIKDTNDFKNIAFQSSNYKIAVYNTNPITDVRYYLPAFGAKRDVKIDFKQKNKISIPVERSVARLDFYFRRAKELERPVKFGTSTDIYINNTIDAGYFAPYNKNVIGNIYALNVALDSSITIETVSKYLNIGVLKINNKINVTVPADTLEPVRLFSLYVPEYINQSEDDNIDVGIKNVIIGNNSLTTDFNIILDKTLIESKSDAKPIIHRNVVYNILCNISDKYKIIIDKITFTKEEWEQITLNKYIVL